MRARWRADMVDAREVPGVVRPTGAEVERGRQWARQDSNLRTTNYEFAALTS